MSLRLRLVQVVRRLVSRPPGRGRPPLRQLHFYGREPLRQLLPCQWSTEQLLPLLQRLPLRDDLQRWLFQLRLQGRGRRPCEVF